jgi:N-acetylmuramoyl-L-alanine amidase
MIEIKPDSATEFQERVFPSQLLTGKIFIVDCGCPNEEEGENDTLEGEEEAALTCALEFGSELTRHGAKVIYTRPRSAGVSLRERIIIANKYPQAVALISWWNSKAGTPGFRIMVQKDEGTAGQLAKAIVQGMEAEGFQLQHTGIFEATGLGVLQKAVMPALLTGLSPSMTIKDTELSTAGVRSKLVQVHVEALLKVYRESIVNGPGYTYRKMRFAGTDVHLVVLKNPQLLVAAAPYGSLATTSDLAARQQASVAINGGFVKENKPDTLIVVNHQSADCGLKLPVSRAVFGIRDDGSMEITQALTAQDLRGYRYALGAGPQLVCGGKVHIKDEQLPSELTAGAMPRAALGLVDEDKLLLTVADGRSRQDRGLTLAELGAFLVARGAVTAMNLAGGGSATLVIGGRVKNDPSDGRERPVANALLML